MFDMSKLGDMAKIANQAKSMQEKQEQTQQEQLRVLNKISVQLDELLTAFKNKV